MEHSIFHIKGIVSIIDEYTSPVYKARAELWHDIVCFVKHPAFKTELILKRFYQGGLILGGYIEFQAPMMNIWEVRNLMLRIDEDYHYMIETLKPIEEFTDERDDDIEYCTMCWTVHLFEDGCACHGE